MAALRGLLLAGVFVLASAQEGPIKQASLKSLNNLRFIFDRLGEPIAIPKGTNQDVLFSVPEEIIQEHFRKGINTMELANRAFSNTVEVKSHAAPNISEALQLGRHEQFSPFIPKHRRMAGRLLEVLLKSRTYDEFLSNGAFCRERVNKFMFTYAMSIATLHRPDTVSAPLPLLASVLPEKFFDGGVFSRAREEAFLVAPENRVPLEIPKDYTASDLEPEHRVAYFREDVGINLHHWHWHLVYPHSGPIDIVRKNRRGELFFYMHQQILARYNFERFCNRLSRAKRYLNWRDPIEEGYFPKLDSLVASRVWPPRAANAIISDLQRDDFEIDLDVQDMERWRDRIYESIQGGRVLADNGSSIPLDAYSGIDKLGDIVESSMLSINPNLYGDVHNMGHMFISLCHDPDHRHLETFGVMGDPTTAMRDPIFYRWHAFINDVFSEHKKTLTPYTVKELGFNGIQVVRADIQTYGHNKVNDLVTFWQQDDIDLSRGLDFAPRGGIFVRVTHLQHKNYSYLIQVQNNGPVRLGTVRIFIAPRFDERGRENKFGDQRSLFVEMDKFTYRFASGLNNIERRSTLSSVTIPYERTFRDLNAVPQSADGQAQFYYCGCGWPQHMLVPKGTADGFPADLFVMVSDFSGDQVNQPLSQPNMCSDGHSMCGIRNQLYPDRRPMGYPFDRQPRAEATTLQRFLTPNMKVTPCTITFYDQILPPGNFSPIMS